MALHQRFWLDMRYPSHLVRQQLIYVGQAVGRAESKCNKLGVPRPAPRLLTTISNVRVSVSHLQLPTSGDIIFTIS